MNNNILLIAIIILVIILLAIISWIIARHFKNKKAASSMVNMTDWKVLSSNIKKYYRNDFPLKVSIILCPTSDFPNSPETVESDSNPALFEVFRLDGLLCFYHVDIGFFIYSSYCHMNLSAENHSNLLRILKHAYKKIIFLVQVSFAYYQTLKRIYLSQGGHKISL